VTLRFGGPRTGKTGEIACRILDAPGAVIATTTRDDLVKLTAPVRSSHSPILVFNPSGFANIPTTLMFNPVAGCEVITVAAHRASDLLAGSSGPGEGGDREWWAEQAERVLRCLMHAAALGEGSMHDVLAWVADPDQGAAQVRKLLRRSPVRAVQDDALQFLTTNDKTRSSICSSVMPALGWLIDPMAARTAEGSGLDVEQLLRERWTVYLIGGEDALVAPLVAALTGHIAREARRIAGLHPNGRLDPPLTLVLDEAALICPVPLDRWTADMGGRNITIHIAAQSRAQLRQRWGDTGAAAILNNAATLLIYGGTRDPGDLHAYATLLGERVEESRTYDAQGRVTSVSRRRSPILTPAQIANLPTETVIAIRRGMRPVVGTTEMAWARRDVRRAGSWTFEGPSAPVPWATDRRLGGGE
jgi:type IV secretory pathway TraG/TraD family ATPase VirD4